jgi:hypothetical protein
MMKTPTMVLRYPGSKAQLQDGAYDYLIVDADDVGSALADGWHRTAAEAKAAGTPKDEPKPDAEPTRAELEQKATELGIKFDGRTGDKKLAALIAEKV